MPRSSQLGMWGINIVIHFIFAIMLSTPQWNIIKNEKVEWITYKPLIFKACDVYVLNGIMWYL